MMIQRVYLGSTNSLVLLCALWGAVAMPMMEQNRSNETNGSIAASVPGLGLGDR